MSTETNFGLSPEVMNQGGITQHGNLDVLDAESLSAQRDSGRIEDEGSDIDQIPPELRENFPSEAQIVIGPETVIDFIYSGITKIQKAETYSEGLAIYSRVLPIISYLPEPQKSTEYTNIDSAMLSLRKNNPKGTRHL